MHRVLVGAACVALVCAAACASSNKAAPGDGGGGVDAGDEACVPYVSTANLTTPVVSFNKDVVPIMQLSCAIAGSTCHGTPDVVSEQRPYLGNSDGGTDAAEVIEGLINVASTEAPSLKLVVVGSPTTSFLMHKVDWDQCTLATDCASTTTGYTTCGAGMPYDGNELDVTARDTIRRWIAQGARND